MFLIFSASPSAAETLSFAPVVAVATVEVAEPVAAIVAVPAEVARLVAGFVTPPAESCCCSCCNCCLCAAMFSLCCWSCCC